MSDKEQNMSGKEKSMSDKERKLSGKEQSMSDKERKMSAKEQNMSGKERKMSGKERKMSGKGQNMSGKEQNMSDKEETQLLLAHPTLPVSHDNPITYKDSSAQTTIHLSQSGSSSIVGSDPFKPPKTGRATPRLSNAIEHSGIYQIALAWKDISVRVNIPGKRGFISGESNPPTQKMILKNITGIASPGCLLAIMGASGSGKSTLLNVLTSRNTKDYIISGEMLLNGVPLSPGAIKNISAYVQQGDLFMETLSVREQLQFRALLRMDRKLDNEARLKRVEEVIMEMGLINCADSRIGAATGTKKGVSGGERKRLSFASEALTNPPIFFCDEPTSSLDSFMAQSIVHTLQKMASRGRVILCTIHQPSSELFAMFNQVLLLSEGRVAFMGSAQDALTYFNGLGYPCPENFNPSDHYILTLAIAPGKEIACKRKTQAICDNYATTDYMKNLEAHIQNQKKDVDMYDHVVLDQITGKSRYDSAFTTQLRMLFWRAWVAQFRNMMLFGVRIGQVISVALILGLVYRDLEISQRGVMNMNGAIFLVVCNMAMTHLFAVLTSFPEEMHLVMREYGSGLYSMATYFFPKVIAELPMFILMSMIFISVDYWMIGFRDEFSAFVTASWVILLAGYTSISVAYLISVATGETTLALSVAAPCLVPLMLFSGLFLNT
ncbi:ATP-binding cassette sub-family g member, partial [Plakobranchus ocellatus]